MPALPRVSRTPRHEPQQVREFRRIPVPADRFFKSHEVYCGDVEPEAVFTSSATTGMTPSRHPMLRRSLLRGHCAGVLTFYGDPACWSLYALPPNYSPQQGFVARLQVDRVIVDCGSGGFYLDDYDALLRDMAADLKPKNLLSGVSYALWDSAEQYAPETVGHHRHGRPAV